MGLQEEEIDDLIKQFREQQENSTDRYLSGILDYLKWITTFDFALVIWIGTNAGNGIYIQNNWLLISIVFIFLSIIVAIITTYQILNFWDKDREVKFSTFELSVAFQMSKKHPSVITQQELEKQRKLFAEKSPLAFKFKKFDKHIILHICALLVGIVFYLFAVFL
jgi:hypothetical protein